ncbi:uncharacterized protein MEPE_05952 [Melanopsichium pennsylvanicum]|uniref:Uncharacterized protein n=1 Tax=Melanopsichium pennsylvanicum TaxID=63383 RepID=A0AAJ5C7S6_9BASI|nr:uncharacterized protein MEPE_05952 [Melanopsichium pennsylvanicum]
MDFRGLGFHTAAHDHTYEAIDFGHHKPQIASPQLIAKGGRTLLRQIIWEAIQADNDVAGDMTMAERKQTDLAGQRGIVFGLVVTQVK